MLDDDHADLRNFPARIKCCGHLHAIDSGGYCEDCPDVKKHTDQEKFWQTAFGDNYTQRNRVAEVGSLRSNVALFSRILSSTQDVHSVIEFGAGDGRNLAAINKIAPFIELSAVEINVSAYDAMPECVSTVILGSILDPAMKLQPQDMAMTKGLLIHVAPADLPQAYLKLYASAKRYILLCEYFCPAPRMIPYRGHDDRLWARDFAGEMLDAYPDLTLKDYGFVSRRDPNPQDDITWWLLEKRV
jgi:spore coat polysaccharide biosynthesis protein SpsF